MVGSSQVENPYNRAVERQRGRGFEAPAQVIGRTAIPFLRKYVVPAAQRIGAGMLEFAAPEDREVISGRKSFKRAAKSVEKQTRKKNWVAVVNRGKLFQQNLLNKQIARQETFLQTFLVDHVKQQFPVPKFCGSVWKSWRECPNC